MKVAAIVLAAGSSSRFGSPKQLATFRGQALVRRAARAVQEAGFSPVIVVVGKDPAAIKAELDDLAADVVVNPEWREGMGASIRSGVQHLIDSGAEVEAVLLLACDQPLIDSAALQELLELSLTSGKPIVASAYADTLGIPAIFAQAIFPELSRLKGEHGAKAIILAHGLEVAAFPSPAAAIDVDTPADYERLN